MNFGSLGGTANQVMIHIRGDDKDFKGALNSSDQAAGSFASKMKSYGPMIGAAFAAAAVGFIAMSVKMAAAEEAVSRQTEALLKSQGIMWKNVSGELNSYMKELEKLTAYNDTDLQVAFNSMIAAGMSYTEAMQSMNTVTSMAYSLNRDLGSMALLVGKAYNGQTGELSRYGIVLGDAVKEGEEFAAVQKYVADNFANAEERADSFEGQMETLKNEMANFTEAIGSELTVPLTDLIRLFNVGGESADSFASKIGKALAIPIEYVVNTKQIEKLSNELLKLESIKERTALEDKRRNEVIVELQERLKGTWKEYQQQGFNTTNTIIDGIGKITDAEEAQYYIQLRRMGASEDYINTLKEQVRIEEQITNELKTQTAEIKNQQTMMDRFKAHQASSPAAARSGAGSSSMSAETARIIYGDDVPSGVKINPNITGAVRSGI